MFLYLLFSIPFQIFIGKTYSQYLSFHNTPNSSLLKLTREKVFDKVLLNLGVYEDLS
jgi:hypothetical protein